MSFFVVGSTVNPWNKVRTENGESVIFKLSIVRPPENGKWMDAEPVFVNEDPEPIKT